MSGGIGYPVTMSGSASNVAEQAVAILSPWRKGMPNSNGTAPTSKARSTYLRETRISNNDATNVLLVRINGAAARTTLSPGETLHIQKALVFYISVQAAVAPVAFDIVGVAA